MKKCAWLMIFYSCLLAQLGYAQNFQNINAVNLNVFELTDSLPEEFIIDISNQVSLCKPGTFELFEKSGILDTTGLLHFSPINNNISLSVHEFNLLFRIYNSSPQKRLVYFKCGLPDLSKFTCIDNSLKQVAEGGFIGNNNRTSPFSPSAYFPVTLLPGKTSSFLFYARFIGSFKEKSSALLLSERSYQLNTIHEIDGTRFQLIYHCLILGGILIISIFMFAQYFLNRDKAYLLYAAYGLCIFLFLEKVMESNCAINLISYFFPYYVFYSHVILQLLASYFYIGFLKKLLELSKKDKSLYWYCYIVQRLILAGCILNIIPFFIDIDSTITTIVYNYGVFVSAVAMLPLLLFLMMLKGKNRSVKFVIVGFTTVVITALTVVYINRSGLYEKFNFLAPISIFEFGIFVEMVFFGLALGYKTYVQKKEKESIELQKQETEMAALKAQMNPHFMFNCINSIDAFIQSNDKYNATLYLNKFAKLIRNVLDSSKQNTVNFTKDVDTLKLYLELEELRHENKFSTEIDIDPELMNSDYKVPPLIIQPFVENAILHGLKNKAGNNGHLHIVIKRIANNIEYTITDDGIGRTAAAVIAQSKETSYGMQLSFDRIKLFNKEKIPSVIIDDLYKEGKACGTAVKVLLKII